MPNTQDHAIQVGFDTLAVRPFDEIDALILTQLVYIPMEGLADRGQRVTVAQLGAFLRKEESMGSVDHFQKKRISLALIAAGVPRYQDWIIYHYESVIDSEREMQFAACCFEMPGSGQTFIAFRGTDWSLAGWKEDFNMSFMTVPSQTEAVEYVERVVRGTGDSFMLGGHSKGGNLSVYAGLRVNLSTQERIRRVYCFDGPGVDKETLDSLEYELLRERIESYLPQSSIVGMLLYYHPVYTVVHSDSRGILQHDALSWQVEDGKFITLNEVDFTGRLTDDALHTWLKEVDKDSRRELVDTLYEVLESTQMDSMDEMMANWKDSLRRIWGAVSKLEPELRKKIMHLLSLLFTAGASGTFRSLLPHVKMHVEAPVKSPEALRRLQFFINGKTEKPQDSGEESSPVLEV